MEVLYTTLESLLKSCPLTSISADVNDYKCWTLNLFLIREQSQISQQEYSPTKKLIFDVNGVSSNTNIQEEMVKGISARFNN